MTIHTQSLLIGTYSLFSNSPWRRKLCSTSYTCILKSDEHENTFPAYPNPCCRGPVSTSRPKLIPKVTKTFPHEVVRSAEPRGIIDLPIYSHHSPPPYSLLFFFFSSSSQSSARMGWIQENPWPAISLSLSHSHQYPSNPSFLFFNLYYIYIYT